MSALDKLKEVKSAMLRCGVKGFTYGINEAIALLEKEPDPQKLREERMTIETVDICSCGLVMHQLDSDDYDTLGSDSGTCCPNCGNENFQTVKKLQEDIERLREANSSLCKIEKPTFKDIANKVADQTTEGARTAEYEPT